MWSRIVLLLCLAFGGLQSGFARVLRVADGDCSGLNVAVSSAQVSEVPTTVLLARGGTYTNCHIGYFSTGASMLTLDAAGARLESPQIAVDGAFALRNVWITAAPGSVAGAFNCAFQRTAAVMCLNGAVTLDTVTISDLKISTDANAVIEANQGDFVLRNLTMANLSISAGVDSSRSAGIEFWSPDASAEIRASTFTNVQLATIPATLNRAVIWSFIPIPRIRVGNSLFAAQGLLVCNMQLGSNGGNVANEGCFGDPTDKLVAAAQLGAFGNHGGLIPTQAISGGSPAHGAGVAQYCEAVDARGYTRSPHGCDAGAYEYGGGSGALTASGLNGFYFDPDANGHYVSLQRIHDNGDIAIVWSTFDANGNPAWVYGVGQLAGKRIHAAMSQNLGGVLQPGGAPTGSSVHAWGTVDIDLTSCALAQFSYQSTIAGFGSGAFPLTRLAFVSDFGCSE